MLRTAMGKTRKTDKKLLEAMLAEFRRGIAHHHAKGASDERIRQKGWPPKYTRKGPGREVSALPGPSRIRRFERCEFPWSPPSPQ
jgi:hypothetical protein